MNEQGVKLQLSRDVIIEGGSSRGVWAAILILLKAIQVLFMVRIGVETKKLAMAR